MKNIPKHGYPSVAFKKEWEDLFLSRNTLAISQDDFVAKRTKLEERLKFLYHTKWLQRLLIFCFGVGVYILFLFVLRYGWNSAIVPAFPAAPPVNLLQVFLASVGYRIFARGLIDRERLDKMDKDRDYKKNTLWLDYYKRKWEVLFLNFMVVGFLAGAIWLFTR